MSTYTQDGRPIAVETPLGKDVLLLRSFMGHEEISRLFEFELDLLSKNETIDKNSIVGKQVSFFVKSPKGEQRNFNGYIKNFSYKGSGDRLHMFQATVVPWFWFLTRTSDCRIYQEKTIPEIIKQVVDELGFSSKLKMQTSSSYRKLDYVVQYRETDFNFLSRLMEQAGLFYYFEHSNGDHVMVVGDSKSVHKKATEGDAVLSSGNARGENHILDWHHGYEYTTGKWAHTDYNFEKPTTDLMGKLTSKVSIGDNSKYEFYDYPGDFLEKSDSDKDAQIRMLEQESGHDVVQGRSACRFFSPGYTFNMSQHTNQAEQKNYILTSVNHSASIGSAYVTGGTHSDTIYENTFTAIPDSQNFKPERRTPKPTIPGIHTAIVVGPSGEEIYTDKYGRIKVQFYWDREGQKNEKSSCWIRVASQWAGSSWGMVSIPRIGMEVVINFLEGDPDKPLVTGCVYNADNMPPYSLPDNKTQSGIKSRSSKKGGGDNFNELRFEDKKGEEEIYLHAEKNFTRIVENNDTQKIGFSKKDDGNQEVEIFNNQTLKVGCAQAKEGSQTIKIWKDRTETLETGDDKITIKKGSRTITMKMGNHTHRLKMGNQKFKMDMGKSETEALQSIELKVGSSSIKIDQMGITIKAPMIKIQGQAMAQIKAPMTMVNGDGMLTLKGGITMIN